MCSPYGVPGSGTGSIYGSGTVFSKFYGSLVLKRPSRRECNTRVRTPTPILMKFGPGVGFGLKPNPDKIFLDFDPKNGVILGSEG